MTIDGDDAGLRTRLIQERGSIAWSDVERHFARGVVIVVAAELDLIEVAARFARDDTGTVSHWLARGLVARANDAQARRFAATSAWVEAIVVAPWVLVQEPVIGA